MASRIELQNTLEKLLGVRHVYYQPPESVKIEYPAIKYSKINIKTNHANNSKYITKQSYQIIVIDSKPDNPVLDKLLKLPYCTYDRYYKADNLNHDVFTLYF